MSTFVAYQPELLSIESAQVVQSVVGGIVGLGAVGQDHGEWVPVDLASFSYTQGYTYDSAAQTLVYDSETATVSLSSWHSSETPGLPESPLRVGDKVKVEYSDLFQYLGTVVGTSTEYTERPAALSRQTRHRVNFTASLLGTYSIALAKRVCWLSLPAETAVDRLSRWVSIVDDPGPWTG
jgi:hypothetical protein